MKTDAEIMNFLNSVIYDYEGDIDQLEGALAMFLVGRLYGWRVIRLIHSKRTIRVWEEVLGVTINEVLPERGRLAYRSCAARQAAAIGNFWKAVSGEIKIPNRRYLGIPS